MAMKLVRKTADYKIFLRGDNRYAVQNAAGKPVNGEEKVNILIAEELVTVAAPPAPEPEVVETEEEAVVEEAAAEEAAEEAPAEEAAEEEAPAEEPAAEEEAAEEEAPAEEPAAEEEAPAEEPAAEEEARNLQKSLLLKRKHLQLMKRQRMKSQAKTDCCRFKNLKPAYAGFFMSA